MKVEKLLDQLKKEFIKVNSIQASLDALVFFLAANLVLFLFSLQVFSSFSNLQVLVPVTLVFFVADLAYRARKYSLEIYEQENPELQEILRTARDNIDRENIASQALFDEVLKRARNVTSDSIIPSKRIVQKILAVGALSFLTVMSGIADFQLQQEGGELLPGGEKLEDILEQDGKNESFEMRNGSEIFGEKQEIDTSDLDLAFNITGSGSSGEGEYKSVNREPDELVLDVSGSGLSRDLELARKYSLAVKEIESSSSKG